MGQQQLLLLVLATVIVGLATVAGIQAFDEGQSQATQDALTQRGIEIGNNILAAHESPSQFGGINLDQNGDAGEVATAAGYDTDDGTGISAEGAGDDAECDIEAGGDGTATVSCSSDSDNVSPPSDEDQNWEYVEVTVDTDNEDPVRVTAINDRDDI